MVVGQVPHDGVRAGVEAGRGEFLTQLRDQVDDLEGCRGRRALRSPGAGLEGSLALDAVAGEEFVEPGLGDAVLGGDVADGSVLGHDGGDH